MDDVRITTVGDGREIAYRVMSNADGPVLLHTSSPTFPMEMLVEDPMYERFLLTLGHCGRLVLFDKPGTGASDPFDPDRGYFEQLEEAYLAVMDAIEVPAAWLVVAASGTTTALLAANHRDRLLGAVIFNPVDPVAGPKLDLAAEDQHDHLQRVAPGRTIDPAYRAWFSRARRMGASGAQTRSFYEAAVASGSRIAASLTPMPDAPPVLLLRRRDAGDNAGQLFWKHIFPDAECLTIEGADSVIEALDAGLVAELMAGFITGGPITAPVERKLVAVLYTDLVDSTPTAAATGDAGWRSTLDRYEATLHRSIERHHGVVVKHTGDGALATFPSASEALAAAVELRGATRDLDLEVRTGIHVGEVEQRGNDIGGIAVHLTARVAAEAEPGEIIVTLTVSLSSLGGGNRFSPRGSRTLKGFEQPWELYAAALNEN